MSKPTQPPAVELIQTLRELRGDLEQLAKSPLMSINTRGKVVVHRTQILLEQLEDLADRVTLLEIKTEKLPP